MPVVTTSPATPTSNPVQRRKPTQTRSIERVAKILDAASRIVVTDGIDALSTRSISVAAGVPVASLYQYFADRDAILLALVARDTEEMDEQVRIDLGTLDELTMSSVVATTMRAYTKVYARRLAFVEIYLRGRTNAAIHEYCRQHNRRTASELREFAVGAGLVRADTPAAAIELAVEIGDRVFQLAYETDDLGDQFVVDEGIAMVTAYAHTYAPTQAPVDGP